MKPTIWWDGAGWLCAYIGELPSTLSMTPYQDAVQGACGEGDSVKEAYDDWKREVDQSFDCIMDQLEYDDDNPTEWGE